RGSNSRLEVVKPFSPHHLASSFASPKARNTTAGAAGRTRSNSSVSSPGRAALEDGLQAIRPRKSLLHRVGRVDLRRVPLDEPALEEEVPYRLYVVRLHDREHDVIGSEDAQRDDLDAELLGQLRDLRRTL